MLHFAAVIIYILVLKVAALEVTVEWLRERTEYLNIFLFSAHHSMVFYLRCSVYWWKGSVRF